MSRHREGEIPPAHIAIPTRQVEEVVEVLTILANGHENALTQSQARILANALTNRLRDNETPEEIQGKRIF